MKLHQKIPYKTRTVFRKLLGETYLDCSVYKTLAMKKYKGWRCSGREEVNPESYLQQCKYCSKYQPNKTLWSNGKTM